MPQIQIERERKRDMQKKIFVVAAICIYIFAFSFAFIMPVSGVFSSIIITDVQPTEFHPGETKEVVLTVKNNGGRDAKDIKLMFGSPEILSLVGPTVAQINTLNSWCEKEVKITVHVGEETPNGVYSIPISCYWKEYYFAIQPVYIHTEDGYRTIGGPGPVTTSKGPVTFSLSFSVIGKIVINVGDISTDPTNIRPGREDVKITASIENSGDAAAKDVEAILLCSETEEFKPSWSGTDRSYIGRLNSGKSNPATFHVDVADNIESTIYTIPLLIRYRDTKNVEYRGVTSIDVLVKPKPELEIVSSYTEPTNISAGDHVILHVRVRNVGSEEGESVSVRVTGEADVPFDYDVKSDHVGNLKVNEKGDAILEFDVDKDAAKKIYQQGLEMRCTGDRDLGDDTVYTFDKQIRLEVTSSSSGSSSIPGFEALFSFIVLLLVFIFIELRKKEKER
nr:hypothetical protein FPOEFMDM_00034 [Methanosarcinales archaeon ANME-1 ERB7]